MTTTGMTLRQELDAMHATYVEAVNLAVAADDDALVEELAQAYDDEATTLVAVREDRTDLLPLVRRARRGDVGTRGAGWLRRAS